MQSPDRVKEFQEKLFRINMDDLIRQTKKEHKQQSAPVRLTIIGYLILGALLCIIVMLIPRHELKATAATLPTPTAVPTPNTPTPAPRGQLMPMPVPATPRAQLIHIRGIGTFENDLMPDGRILGTTYRGELPSTTRLPTYGAQLGDMWYTQNDGHCWVLAPISPTSPTIGWVDP
jgi:hypothetical protein